MHLLAAQPGGIADGSEAVDLAQSPGDIVVLSAADTELASLSRALRAFPDDFARVRLANLMNLRHNLSVDLYVEQVIEKARLVVVRLLGGAGYWSYGVERIAAACARRDVALALLPGDDQPDAELDRLCTLERASCHRLWQYLVAGGLENARNFMGFAGHLAGFEADWAPPRPLLRAGLYWPGTERPDLDRLRQEWAPDSPVAALTFYRALVQSGNLAPVDALIAALRARGINPLPVFVASLKDPASVETLQALFARAPPGIVLNATGFAVGRPGQVERPEAAATMAGADCPVLQVIFAGGAEAAWRDGARGLGPQDLAMNVVLPEVDGRIVTRAVSFKREAEFDARAEHSVTVYGPVADRVDYVAALAGSWLRLRRTAAAERRVALVLANYPTRDGRIGNGVGLDTPASVAALTKALAAAGYDTGDAPADAAGLMVRLLAGPTNARRGASGGSGGIGLPLGDYARWFAALPEAVRTAVGERWGAPGADPAVRDGAFRLAVHRFGNLAIGIQPSRGYDVDPVRSYHDPDLVPPHAYFAFYAWLARAFDAHAIVHVGKHGNLEWLPGKAVALSDGCFPEAAFAPLPHLYPFIVNDPGEGTQAKRRAAAVIVDHLVPPLTRAESYGPLKDLEALVDEYFEAAGMDPRRIDYLRGQILDMTRRLGLDRDCGIAERDDSDTALAKLDNHLCELKEMQIRDGLHVFGAAPQRALLDNLLVALTRVPRAVNAQNGQAGEGADASLIRALAADLGLDGFDPLDCTLGAPWIGPRPEVLANGGGSPWRTCGDTVELLEALALRLVAGEARAAGDWTRTRAVLDQIERVIRPAVEASGARETGGVLRGLDGRFVAPGPSGAPTRGRLDVLPTGRNFYSVDTRTVPTPAAWQLGWKSASLLLDRYRQDHGEWPAALAISAWGTANMRTGGEDIAQALALMGVRPTWDSASRRLTGFEIMPLSVLDRPRVDVTLRISGMFRDAFPSQIDLFDSAVRAVAALDEPADGNPLAARVGRDAAALGANGAEGEAARRRAAHRVFGSKPGAYGAGLQALIDSGGWETDADLARAYMAWSGYAYGDGAAGAAEHGLFESRLRTVQAVVHNQDNREHDLLDSDDYYQFEGGLTAAVREASGRGPAVYHNDHSRPESPKVRTLSEEIGRVVRARVVNPKWIRGVMRHGYKGAFEMAATVDYLFAFAATTGMVGDHHFDAVYDAFIADGEVRGFLEEHNPAACREIAQRLVEARDRQLWRPRSNSAYGHLAKLAGSPGESP